MEREVPDGCRREGGGVPVAGETGCREVEGDVRGAEVSVEDEVV